MSKDIVENIFINMSEICQARMLENMSEDMAIQMSKGLLNKNNKKNIRRYVRRNIK